MIQLKSINKRYLHEHVLDNISCTLPDIGFVSLIGPSDVEKVLYFILLLDSMMIILEKSFIKIRRFLLSFRIFILFLGFLSQIIFVSMIIFINHLTYWMKHSLNSLRRPQ